MDPNSLEYKRKVWEFLENMEPEKKYTINKLCEPENRIMFIEAIKEYMRALPWSGYVTFNHDYSQIYRMYPPIIK